MVGVSRRSVNQKNEEVKAKLANLDNILDRAKGLSLDEKPQTKDVVTATILEKRKDIEKSCEGVLITEKSKWRFSDVFADGKNAEDASRLLDQLALQIDSLSESVSRATLSRRDLGLIGVLALKRDPSSNSVLSGAASKKIVWPSVSSQNVSEVERSICEKLCLTESQLITWWYGSGSVSEGLSVWEDMSTLSQRVVTLRDLGKRLDTNMVPELGSFQRLVEDAKIVTADLVQLLIDYPNQEHEFLAIFTLIVFATFAMSAIVTSETDVVLGSVPALSPIMIKLKDLCATIGGRLMAQPYINVANDADMNSSSKPNPSTFDPSADNDSFSSKADMLVTTGLIQNHSILHRMFGKFKVAKQDKAFRIFSNEEHKPFAGKKLLSVQDLVDLGLKKIDLDFSQSKYLGRGSYGEINRHRIVNGPKFYAVKKPLCKNSGSSQRTWNRLIREAEIWRNYVHPNICRLHGFCTIPDYPFPGLVMDECIRSVDEYLQSFEDRVDEVDRFMLLKDVASGLSHIHEHQCAHGDLRAANILVQPQPSGTGVSAVLADFGVSDMTVEIGERISKNSTGQKTNDAWLAPEFFIQKNGIVQISASADVYAFGCVFLEILFEEEPYYFHRITKQYRKLSIPELKKKKVLPAEEQLLKPKYYSFIEKVCAFDQDKRPKSEVLIRDMTSFGEQAATAVALR